MKQDELKNKSLLKFDLISGQIIIERNEDIQLQQNYNLEENPNVKIYFGPLLHADQCPVLEKQFKELSIQNEINFKTKQIRLASICYIIDKDGFILLTRRSKQMRTFPCCWVTPGGRVDYNEKNQKFEDPAQAAQREVEEEVGIKLEKENLKQFCFYESVYPTMESPPQSQNLIIAFYTILDKSFKEVEIILENNQNDINFIQEVDQIAWIHFEQIKQLIFNHKQVQNQQQNKLPEFQFFFKNTLSQNIQNSSCIVELEQLKGKYPNQINQGIGEAHCKSFRVILPLLKNLFDQQNK